MYSSTQTSWRKHSLPSFLPLGVCSYVTSARIWFVAMRACYSAATARDLSLQPSVGQPSTATSLDPNVYRAIELGCARTCRRIAVRGREWPPARQREQVESADSHSLIDDLPEKLTFLAAQSLLQPIYRLHIFYIQLNQIKSNTITESCSSFNNELWKNSIVESVRFIFIYHHYNYDRHHHYPAQPQQLLFQNRNSVSNQISISH